MPRKGDETRTRILTALDELLATTRLEDVSIAELTRRAHVTRSAFYFHFPTKGAAVASLMESLFDAFTSLAGDWYGHVGTDQSANLRRGMADTVAMWRRHSRVMHAMAQAAATDPAARRLWEGWVGAFAARARPTLRADLHGLPDAEVDRVADLLVTLTFDAMQRDVRSIVERDTPTPDLAATLSTVWVRVIYR